MRAGVIEQWTRRPADRDRRRRAHAARGPRPPRHRAALRRASGHRIDFADLTGGRGITVYGQHEVVKDLDRARGSPPAAQILFEVEGRERRTISTASSRASASRTDGEAREHRLRLHRRLRRLPRHLPADASRRACSAFYERVYPFGWLGILAEAPPASEELIYAQPRARLRAAQHALDRASAGSTSSARPTRTSTEWPDERIWNELQPRLETGRGWRARPRARSLQKGVTAMRSFVAEPMQHGRLFLAGDAAHIVPPTGAKGMNLAVADVRVLSRALAGFYKAGTRRTFSTAIPQTCLRRVWRAQRFSWWMTSHAAPVRRRQRLRPPPAARRARLCDELARRGDDAWPRTTSACRWNDDAAARHPRSLRHPCLRLGALERLLPRRARGRGCIGPARLRLSFRAYAAELPRAEPYGSAPRKAAGHAPAAATCVSIGAARSRMRSRI